MVSPDGVVPSRMVSVSASVNLPLHHKVQKFSSGTGSPGWSWKKGCKRVVVVVVCCGQTAGRINMPVGTEVGCGPGDIVLDGDPAPPQRGTAPNFRPMSIVAKQSTISATAEHLSPLLVSIFCVHKCTSLHAVLQTTTFIAYLSHDDQETN